MRNRKYIYFVCILLLAFIAGNLVYPTYIRKLFPSFPDIPFKLGLDLQGGTHLVYEADLSNIAKQDYSAAMEGLRDIIERRVNMFGITEPVVQTQDSGDQHRLVVELAGVKDPEEAIKMIGQTPFLEFRTQRLEEETQKILDKRKELEGKTNEEIEKINDWQIALQDPYFVPTELTGKYLKKAELAFDPQTNDPTILLSFNDEGSKIFEQLTEQNVGKVLAIYIDGVAISTPVVQEKITGGQARISGKFSIDEAKNLVKNLNAGALPVPIKLISQQSVGPTLGLVSLQQSLKAGLIGFLLVFVFMIIYYRLSGFLASLALGLYLLLNLSVYKLVPITLTLAGIGGFILSVGMAVDANILIFARMKEEIKQGKSFSVAVQEGFKRSWPAIMDGNITLIIVALVLFWLGTSFIKGFALTLIIGTIISIFSAVFVTRTLFNLFVGTKLENFKRLWN